MVMSCKRSVPARVRPVAFPLLGLCISASPLSAAFATTNHDDEIASLQRQIAAQQSMLDEERQLLTSQQHEIDELKAKLSGDAGLADLRGAGPASAPPPSVEAVGEAPPREESVAKARVAAVPEAQGVLTPAGHFVFDPQIEYLNSADNRLVFRGFELIPGIQIGSIEASTVESNTVVATAALRYGITNRLEAEVRVPFLYRHDHQEVVQQREQGIVRTLNQDGRGIGDAEFALRYQLNNPSGQHPIWVAELRAKSDTGKSPFGINYDEYGVAEGLATGSGFWGVQPGISFLLPSDPVVLYGGASYLWQIPRDVNKTVGTATIGHVHPGGAINASVGFGFALNPRFSFSLGYKHSYLFPTITEISDTKQRSDHLQVGALTFGMAYRLTEHHTLNLGFAFGVTKDAPRLDFTIRMPLQF
jgi:hypothetical protein